LVLDNQAVVGLYGPGVFNLTYTAHPLKHMPPWIDPDLQNELSATSFNAYELAKDYIQNYYNNNAIKAPQNKSAKTGIGDGKNGKENGNNNENSNTSYMIKAASDNNDNPNDNSNPTKDANESGYWKEKAGKITANSVKNKGNKHDNETYSHTGNDDERILGHHSNITRKLFDEEVDNELADLVDSLHNGSDRNSSNNESEEVTPYGVKPVYNCREVPPPDLPSAIRCDGVKHCIAGEDEKGCVYSQQGCG